MKKLTNKSFRTPTQVCSLGRPLLHNPVSHPPCLFCIGVAANAMHENVHGPKYRGLVMLYVIWLQIFINISSGDMLTDGTVTVPELILKYHLCKISKNISP